MNTSNNKKSSVHPAIYLIALVLVLFAGFSAYATDGAEQGNDAINIEAKDKPKEEVKDPKPSAGFCCIDPPNV